MIFFAISVNSPSEETSTIRLGSTTYTANEGTQLIINIFRNGDSPFVVNISTIDNTAVFGRDYSLPEQMVTFSVGEFEKNIVVDLLEDNVYERPENFTLTLQTSQLNMSQATVTINDLTGTYSICLLYFVSIALLYIFVVVSLTFVPRDYIIVENGGSVNLTVRRNLVNLSSPINLQLRVISQTAKSN